MNIIIFSSIDWNFNWQLPQQLAKYLSDQGKNVIFINNTGSRSIKFKDLIRLKDKFLKTNYKKEDNLNILNPIFIPIHNSVIIDKINTSIFINLINKNFRKETKDNKTIIISFLATKLIYKISNKILNSKLIYYLADEFEFQHRYRLNTNLIDFTRKFIRKTDCVICTSNNLYNKYKNYNKKMFLVPSGVDLKKFNLLKKIKYKNNLYIRKKPTIGFIGSVSYILDFQLINKVASANPEYDFVFVGPKYQEVNSFKLSPNIHFQNQVSHDEIPFILNSFDIGMLPYKVNDFTNKVYPFKVNEYLAVGLPVISTKTLEMVIFNKNHNNVIRIINNEDEFNSAIKDLYKNKNYNKNDLINIAKNNSWDKRMLLINKILNSI